MARDYGPGCYDPLYERGGCDYSIAQVRWTANRNMELFLRMIASGQVELNPLISHEFPLDEAARAYGTVMDPASSSLAVVLRYPAAEQTNDTGEEVSKPLRKVE